MFRSRYVKYLEAEVKQLKEELRHWQNQCLEQAKLKAIPKVAEVDARNPTQSSDPKNLKPINPKGTFHERQAADMRVFDRQWASDVVDTEIELSRAREALNGTSR